MPRVVLMLFVLGLVGYAIRRVAAALADPEPGWGEPGADLPVPDDPAQLPEWLHAVLLDTYAAEREGWALERVRRVEARLQAPRPPDQRFETVILWVPEANAFTLPGRRVYLSRRLLERAPDDETVAFVVAHEIAHHDLGHMAEVERWLARLASVGGAAAAGLAWELQGWLYGPEREADADAQGLNLCLAAGYDPYRCVRAFDLMEMLLLDQGDVQGVFGPAAVIDARLAGKPDWWVELLEWRWERRRGYPSLRDRKARLLAAYEEAAAATERDPSPGLP